MSSLPQLLSLENSRMTTQKSHRVAKVCYRSGDEMPQHTHARRLDGYTLYAAFDQKKVWG